MIKKAHAIALGGITIYNIDGSNPIYLNTDNFGAPYIPLTDYHPIALSPDNRYLIAAYNAIRVWDLHNLPENINDRLPIYRHGGPEARIWSARFINQEIIETTSEESTQWWILHTGEFVPQS